MEPIFFFVVVSLKQYEKTLADGTLSFYYARVQNPEQEGSGYRTGAVRDENAGDKFSFWKQVSKKEYEKLTELVGQKRWPLRAVEGTCAFSAVDFQKAFGPLELSVTE